MSDVSMIYFKSVQEMKQATNLVVGDFVQTLGFYKIGDCGEAKEFAIWYLSCFWTCLQDSINC